MWCSPAANLSHMVTSVVITHDWKLDKFKAGFDLPFLNCWYFDLFIKFSSYRHKLSLKKVLTKCVWQYFFQKFSFSNKVWFCPDIFSWFLFGQPLPIFVVLNFFRKRADLKIACCFFILGLMLLWSRVQQNHPDEKSVGDFQSWESNRGQQSMSRTDK